MQRRVLRSIFIMWCIAVLALLFLLPDTPHASMVAMWTFDEDEGAEVSDLSGNNHHGVVNGGVEWTDGGKFGGALSFNGIDGWVEVPSYTSSPEMTVMAWVYIDNLDGKRSIVEKYDWVAGKGSFLLRAYTDATARITRIYGAQSLPFAVSPSIVKTQEWIHLAGTIDRESITLYMNGEEVGADKMPDSDGILASDATLVLGTIGDNHNNNWFAGFMDEVAIFDEAVSEGVIERIVKFGLQGYLAVRPGDKLPVTWGIIKSNL
ncbi:LamG domain-containing protein [Candidatus Poribacteria bacterium]